MRQRNGERGQASVELVALLPLVAVIGLALWQGVLAGHTWWMATISAQAGARAALVGRDPAAAARAVLPARRAREVRVVRRSGVVRVRLAVPAVVPGLAAGTMTARATVEEQ